MSRTYRFALIAALVSITSLALVACSGKVVVPFDSQRAESSQRKLARAAADHRRASAFLAHLVATNATATSPATIPTLAPFQGNLTVVQTVPVNGVALQRQADCSLLFTNFLYSFTTSQMTATTVTQTPGYEKILHDNASLTTTPDVFAKGCTSDSTLGQASAHTAFLGVGKSGQYIGAALDVGAIYVATMSGSTSFTFSTPVALTPDLPAVSIAGADLNKDGNQDLVSINDDGINSSMNVFLGNGDGTFQAAKKFEIPAVVANYGFINDMNGDGNLDIVVGTGSQSTFQFLIYLGDGKGNFAAAVPYNPNLTSLSFDSLFVSADVNGDGHVDIITSEGQVFLGQASGTNFSLAAPAFPPIVGSNELAPGMIVGDFNGDKKMDLATDDGAVIRTYLGNGDGTFSTGPAYATISNRGLILGTDLDGDGNLDLFSGFYGPGLYGGDDYLPNQAYALMGKGDGTFAGAPVVPAQNIGTNLVDLNGDGRPDLVGVTTNSQQSTFTTYLTNPSGVPTATSTLVTATNVVVDSFGLAPLETKSNTNVDLIWVSAAPQTQFFYLSLGDGAGNFAAPTSFPVPSLVPSGVDNDEAVTGLQVADINHDGKADLIYFFSDADGVSQLFYEGFAVQLGNGDGTFQAPKITVLSTSSTVPGGIPPSQLANVIDVTGDGFPDVFVVAPTGISNGNEQYENLLFVGNGDGSFKSPNTLALGTTVRAQNASLGEGFPFAFADLDGDGKLDIVAAGTSSDQTTPTVAVALGNGDGTFKPAATFTLEGFGFAGSPALADFNGDKKFDLFVPGAIEGTGGIFLGNGNGTFQTVSEADGTVGPTQLIPLSSFGGSTAVDLNGDKAPDILTGAVVLINKAGAVVTPAATSTALTSSLNPSTLGANVTFTATVTSATAGTITGTVNFFDAGTQIGNSTVGAGGVATLQTASLTQATHSITAVYGGDTNYLTSTSPAVSQVVNGTTGTAPTTVVLVSNLNPSIYGVTVQFTATVTSKTAGTITGTVALYSGTTNQTSGPVNSAGNVVIFSTDFVVGANSMTAKYSGDATYAPSTSTVLIQNVTIAPTTTTLTASPTSGPVGTNITFSGAVTTTAGPGPVPGTVNILDGATNIGTATASGGAYTFSTSTLAAGTHSITAQFAGNADYSPSTSSATQVNITAAPGSFTLSANPTSLTVSSSAPGTSTITVTPTGGFNQTVNFSCASSNPSIACSFSPAGVTPNGGPASTVATVTFDFGALATHSRRGSAAAWWPGNSGGGPFGGASKKLTLYALGGELALFALLFARRKKFASSQGAMRFAYALLLCAITVTFMSGCAGSGPAPQNITISVNGTSGTQTVSVPIAVTINN